jgi:predicted lipid-binding transport protein (Tim44 family)
MGASGGFPIDIILFGMIAAFLVLRLKGILGKRTGYERPPQPIQPREAPAAPASAQSAPPAQAATGAKKMVPEPVSALGQTLARMQSIDGKFSPGSFLDGAEKAFEIIVRAFATGDRAALRPLLGDETWKAFDLAIAEHMSPTSRPFTLSRLRPPN